MLLKINTSGFPFPDQVEDKFHGNDIFIHWGVVVIPAEAGIQYL